MCQESGAVRPRRRRILRAGHGHIQGFGLDRAISGGCVRIRSPPSRIIVLFDGDEPWLAGFQVDGKNTASR